METQATVARVAWLEKPGRLVWREETLGPPGAGSHLCRARVSAISPGTELAAWTGAPPLRPGPGYPRLMGYCHVADVVASGAGTERARPGDRVLSFTSHRSAMHLSDRDVLAVVPDGLDDAPAAVAYLFHLGYNAVLRADVRAGARVTVVGLGALGIAAVACASLAGAEVAAVSGQPTLRALARGAGARWTGDRSEAEADSGAARADVVVLTTNGWEDLALAMQLAGQRGTIAVLGFPGRGLPPPTANPLPSAHFYMKQLRLEAVGASPEVPDSRGFARFNERDNLAFLLRALADGRLDAGPFVTHWMPGERLAEAYAALGRREPGQLTTLLTW